MRLAPIVREMPIGVLAATAATALLTAILAPFRHEVGLLNEGLLLLLLTLLISAVWGRAVGIYTAVITNLSLNFFFIDPLHTFTVSDPKNIVALSIFLIVSIVGGALLSAARQAAAEAKRRQAETEVALRLSRAMGGRTEPEEALRALCEEVVHSFAAPGAAVLTRPSGAGWQALAHAGSSEAGRQPDTEERTALERAAAQGTFEGLGFTGLSRTRRRRIIVPRGRESVYNLERSVAFVPLKLGERVLGVLRVDGPIGDTPFRSEPEGLLAAVASEAAIAVQRAELAREAAHTQALREADEMKTALMASISHDLKTPLAAIKGAIASVRDKSVAWAEDDIEAFNETIESQTDRLNRLISDILDLNRIESGSLKPEQEPVRAADLLQRARELTLPQTRGREVTLEAPGTPKALTDESLITQALVNLIENAAKYSKPGGAIHLKAQAHAGRAFFSVEDEGPGIAPEDLPYVFERFYRAEEHSGRVKGSGLGLTIVKAFVELCGGEVSVESSPKGTTFTIKLPAVVAERVTV
jgi:two-component system, OmpR family, sensor histidine kinase KdpD